jgi:chemotaxis signal transduction protein
MRDVPKDALKEAAKERERRPLSSVAPPARPQAATAGPVILFTAGGMRFAVLADQVQEIRDGDQGTLVPKLKSTKTIDFALQVGLGAGILERLVVLKPGECALAVTDVERIATIPRVVSLPGLFRGMERLWYRGLLLLEDELVPLVRTEYWCKAAMPAAGSGRAGHE